MTIRLLWTLGGYKPDGEDVESGAETQAEAEAKVRRGGGRNAPQGRRERHAHRLNDRRLALHYSDLNDTEVVRLIVDKDEHAIEVEDLDGKAALDLAFDLSHTGVSHELIAKGALGYRTFVDLEQVVAWRQHLIDDEMFVNALGRQIRFRTEGLPQDDASELFNLLDGVINSGLGTDLPALVRSEVVAPIVTNKEMVSYLKRKERMECLKKSCVEQLEFLQEQQDEIYAKDRLAQALGKLGNDLKLGEDPEKGGKAIVSRQDAKDLLPKTTGGGLNEAGIHVLAVLALVLNEGYNDKLCAPSVSAPGQPDVRPWTLTSRCLGHRAYRADGSAPLEGPPDHLTVVLRASVVILRRELMSTRSAICRRSTSCAEERGEGRRPKWAIRDSAVGLSGRRIVDLLAPGACSAITSSCRERARRLDRYVLKS